MDIQQSFAATSSAFSESLLRPAQLPHYHRFVIVESYVGRGEPLHNIYVRPLPGQDLPSTMNVECAFKMRVAHPPGTVFKVWMKISCGESGPTHLYTSWRWDYDVISADDASAFIERRLWETGDA